MADVQSQAELALYYRYGIGVEPTMELDTYLYKKATEQDNQSAIETLRELE